MDDRFDRRELLLHLGDILDVLRCLAKTSGSGALVTRLVQENDSLRKFEFLRALSPDMTVALFTQRVASAFSDWPKLLLEAELDRDALASTVQCRLFDGEAESWNAYVAQMQEKVKWFGSVLPGMKTGAGGEPMHEAVEAAMPVRAEPSPERDVPRERKGWPWPEPKTTS